MVDYVLVLSTGVDHRFPGFLFVIGCALAGCLLGYLMATLGQNPDRTRWQQLPPTPQPASWIIEIGSYGAETHSITVETASGDQYDCYGT
ncbi:hypothetical protein [Leptolinea tardivitalis]|uniref:Uncharacterized protein n=1 Tax=Leptolinea tardivitalis TaxID=229920 RepID=A0A0P6X1U4_9CHLR|nr:hypothetical protein [Leptolinea tardivitalis]KPL73251.1 hypothetical protein ADM99_03205 [Leptolinea tardivitalis]